MCADYPLNLEKNIARLVQGPQFPEKEFVRSGATFAEIYALAARLRFKLADDEDQGKAVCLATDNKAIMAAALLASLGGGPALLLPYAFSPGAIQKMQEKTGFTSAISDPGREFPENVNVIHLQSAISHQNSGDIHTPLQSELLQIFTGGSTGLPQVWPKTVMNIFGECFFLAERYKISAEDCVLATIPPNHIYGLLFSVVLPLITSATVVKEVPSFPDEISRAAKENKITILASIPTHYRVLREKEISLRLAVSSAGMLDAEDNKAFSLRNKTGIEEIYGSTETGGIGTRNRFQGEEFFTPFPTIDWKIKNHRLAVRSHYISPTLPLDKEGFFTTSDRVEAEEAGKFSLKGRVDTVTKVGGKRVDLQEISDLIKAQSDITDCIVLALPEKGGREHRIGALIQGPGVKKERIRKLLTETLEPYALPRRIKVVDRIPVNENGKYDRRTIIHLLEK